METIDLGQIIIKRATRRTGPYLSGTVTVDGAPGVRRVALFDRRTMALIATTRSRPDGTYEFYGLPEYPQRTLLAIAFDDKEQKYNAEIADFLTQAKPDQT